LRTNELIRRIAFSEVERKAIALELLRIAKLLSGILCSGSNVSDSEISRVVKQLKRNPLPVPQRAVLYNQIGEIAYRGKDSVGLSQAGQFRGWGRGDFIKLDKRLRRRKAITS